MALFLLSYPYGKCTFILFFPHTNTCYLKHNSVWNYEPRTVIRRNGGLKQMVHLWSMDTHICHCLTPAVEQTLMNKCMHEWVNKLMNEYLSTWIHGNQGNQEQEMELWNICVGMFNWGVQTALYLSMTSTFNLHANLDLCSTQLSTRPSLKDKKHNVTFLEGCHFQIGYR